MWYITDTRDLSVLEDAELTTLVINLPALREIIRDEDIRSRVTQPDNAKILSRALGIKVKISKKPLKRDELQKRDIVLLLAAKQHLIFKQCPDDALPYLILALM